MPDQAVAGDGRHVDWTSMEPWPVGVRVSLRVPYKPVIEAVVEALKALGQTEATDLVDKDGVPLSIRPPSDDASCVLATTVRLRAPTAAAARLDVMSAVLAATAAGEAHVRSVTVAFPHP